MKTTAEFIQAEIAKSEIIKKQQKEIDDLKSQVELLARHMNSAVYQGEV